MSLIKSKVKCKTIKVPNQFMNYYITSFLTLTLHYFQYVYHHSQRIFILYRCYNVNLPFCRKMIDITQWRATIGAFNNGMKSVLITSLNTKVNSQYSDSEVEYGYSAILWFVLICFFVYALYLVGT